MTLYPASNWRETTVPEGAGGCGQPHRRPYVNGAPVHPYGLDCPPCEDFLRVHNSDQWSTTLAEIPETYDETKEREQSEKSGKLDRERQLADTMIELRELGQLPRVLGEALDRMLGAPAAALAGAVVCPQGHDNQPGKKFCADCGSPLSQPVTKAALPGPERPAEPPAAPPFPSHGDRQVRVQDLRLDELQAACRAAGLPDAGVRKELIKRLRTAGVSNADLSRLLVAA